MNAKIRQQEEKNDDRCFLSRESLPLPVGKTSCSRILLELWIGFPLSLSSHLQSECIICRFGFSDETFLTICIALTSAKCLEAEVARASLAVTTHAWDPPSTVNVTTKEW